MFEPKIEPKEEATSQCSTEETPVVVEAIIIPKKLLLLGRDKQRSPDRVFVVFPDVKLKIWVPSIDFFNKGKDYWGTMADVKDMDLGDYKELRFSIY